MRERFIIRKLKQLSRNLGHRLIDATVPSELFIELLKYRESSDVVKKNREHEFLAYVLRHYSESNAQLLQDLFVLFLTGEKKKGFFVEFGATNGITLSNSYLLEKKFGWEGILAEPGKNWHDDLNRNRSCKIETRCVWSESGKKLEFNEVAAGELSTINAFSNTDHHAEARKRGEKYFVESVSLNDLLITHNAPYSIDYLSVDTEGSELTILKNFDFSKYDIRIITVEHNFTPEREKIHSLLKKNGYCRVFEGFSQWDDWYTKTEKVRE